MKFKLDENLGTLGLRVFVQSGIDCMTVDQQYLRGKPDHHIATVCATEQRCLVTLDLDFANPISFPPRDSAGLAVLRPHGIATDRVIDGLVQSLIHFAQGESLHGKLVIIEPTRIRVFRDEAAVDPQG